MAGLSFSLGLIFYVLALAPLCLCRDESEKIGHLYPQYYNDSCPQAPAIVKSVVAKAVAKEDRIAASLIRLHFQDCIVQGCDASNLLDNAESIISEKQSNYNRNSARGYEVIDEIKKEIEKACPDVVSCADILALAARDSTVLAGGPGWEVPLGRRDSLEAYLNKSNQHIPAPNNTFETILLKFKRKGLNLVDMVALSGAHTIGDARCTNFRERLYINHIGNGKPDSTLDQSYANQLRGKCPRSGGDQNLFSLDFVSPLKFDNSYFKNLLANKGLLSSDQVLTSDQQSLKLVKTYAGNKELFFKQFAVSMVKMGKISPLTWYKGQIMRSCRKNHNDV